MKGGTDPFLSIAKTYSGPSLEHMVYPDWIRFSVCASVSVRGRVSGNGNGRGRSTGMEGNRYDRFDGPVNLHMNASSSLAC